MGDPMTPRTLLAKIEELPPDKQAEVERFVDSVRARLVRRRSQKPEADEFLTRINERRERLFREHGLFPGQHRHHPRAA